MTLKQAIKGVLGAPLFEAMREFEKTSGTSADLRQLRDLVLAQQTYELQRSHPNPLNRFGNKCFSQTDEDGITLEILKRIGSVDNGRFAEFGVGDGTENNTLILKALGWKGFWVGGEALAFEIKQPKEQFSYFREWVTLENIENLAKSGLKNIGSAELDVISLDLDGNDIYFVEKLLSSGLAPKLFIVEYNAKFIPPIRWQMQYDANHVWKFDDYFGASLMSFVELFKKFDFALVCCNSHSGTNAFFVRNDFSSSFADVPKTIDEIYVGPRYYLYRSYGHRPSPRTIAKLFA